MSFLAKEETNKYFNPTLLKVENDIDDQTFKSKMSLLAKRSDNFEKLDEMYLRIKKNNRICNIQLLLDNKQDFQGLKKGLVTINSFFLSDQKQSKISASAKIDTEDLKNFELSSFYAIKNTENKFDINLINYDFVLKNRYGINQEKH